VLDDGTTQIAVRSGEVEIFSPRGSQRVQPGHSILVRGNPSDPEFQNTYELARDQFDDWSATRDRELLASQSYRHVSPDIYGADDLDAYGNWVPSQYGQVWAPQPPVADWSPYSYGQWTWENYYGWTWVDSAPWGWAPYHYGRWFWNTGYGWCWWPGAGVGMTLWSPALVGFFGWGGFGLGFGGLGWVALAPFEVFHGWWGHGWGHGWDGGWRGGYGGYGRGNVASMYRNAAFRGGAMTAGANGFGRPGQRFSPATRAQLTNATAYHGQIPVSPTRASYQFTNRQATANPRLASAANRQFFQHQQFRSQASPGNVSRGAAAPSAARGFTGNAAVANGSRFGASPQASHGTPPNLQGANAGRNGGATGTGAGGWQRFGQPGTANSFRQGYAGGQETSGWHRFGQPQPSGSGVNGQPRGETAPNYGGRSMGSGGTSRGNYESRPLGMSAPGASQRPSFSGYGNGSNGAYGGRPTFNAPRSSAPAMPHYNAPAPQHYSAPAPHYSAPAAPHYSAPSSRGGGGGGSHGGGGGGGGHSSSGGHHGR